MPALSAERGTERIPFRGGETCFLEAEHIEVLVRGKLQNVINGIGHIKGAEVEGSDPTKEALILNSRCSVGTFSYQFMWPERSHTV